MTNPEILIPEPCPADFSAMPACEKGLYCDLCKKHVLDLRHKNRKEVVSTLEKNPGACVVMDGRHVQNKRTWNWAENFAGFMRGYKLNRIAALFLALCLLLASCRRRAMGGAYAFKDQKNQNQTEKL
jgi:hypothetical protein